MAIVATVVVNQKNYQSYTLTCLDADTTVTLTFSTAFPAAPDEIFIQPLISVVNTALANWAIGTVTATTAVLNKQNAAGSGGGVPGTTLVAKLYVKSPHSIGQ
jgi:hypothetical protein